MKQKNKIFMVLLSVLVVFVSCQKTEMQKVVEDSFQPADNIRSYLVNQMGFSSEGIIETKDQFIVENCYAFDKANFVENYFVPEDPNARHYKYPYLIASSTKTIFIKVSSNVPSAWKTAIQQAIYKWNALTYGGKYLRLKFHMATATSPMENTILVTYESMPSSDYYTFARTNYPTSTGRPGAKFIINKTGYWTNRLTASEKLKTAVHELGHAIGFRHTDSGQGALIVTPSYKCNNQINSVSIMNTGRMSFTDFSTCDKLAFLTVYPK